MIRIGICDDEVEELERLGRLIEEFFQLRNQDCVLSAFRSGDELLSAIDQGFDLIFLDIYMGLEDGIAVAKRIRVLDKTCVIIFATNSRAHAIRGYGVRALQYLLKPIGAAELNAALDLAVEELSSRSAKSVQLVNRQGNYRIALDDLAYAESRARLLTVHTRSQGDIRYYDRLDNLEALCDDERFLRCHKSFLVNLDYVDAIVNDKALMRDGQEIPISMSVSKAKEAFASHIAGGRRPLKEGPSE